MPAVFDVVLILPGVPDDSKYLAVTQILTNKKAEGSWIDGKKQYDPRNSDNLQLR